MEQIKRIPLVRQVEEQIEKLIADENYRPGTKLPPEVELCKALGVSRGTVREAFRFLQAKGVVELQAGKGAFVAELKAAEDPEAISWLVENEDDLKNFMELRVVLEPLAARQAAECAGEEAKAALQEIHRQFVENVRAKNYQELPALDEKFHATIIESCSNALLRELLQRLNLGMKGFRKNTFRVRQNAQDTVGPHGNVLMAIVTGDPVKAEREMRKHVNKVSENLALNISTAVKQKSE